MSDPASSTFDRILVVDDESALVTALVSTLREHGYRATGVTTPSAALELLRSGEAFDVMLTDLHLPEMDGIALLRAALEIDPQLTGILMTGHGTVDTAVDAMKTGAVDYILKPFKLRSVLAVLSRALELRRLRLENAALTARLARRTRELEAANKELEAFSYSVSHDLRAPLRTIEGFTDALIEEAATLGGQSQNLQDYGVRIKRGVRRMGSMIEALLRMARAARIEMSRGEVDLGRVTREIMAKLQADAPGRQVELHVDGDLTAIGDPGLLQIVMENLLGNAWKYTGQRSVTKLEVGATEVAGERVFHVRDNGIGFEMSEARQLFVPFHRLNSASKFEGTGIGLATVRRIVERHGGRIWAEAKLGAGATFFFTLPDPAESSRPPLPTLHPQPGAV